ERCFRRGVGSFMKIRPDTVRQNRRFAHIKDVALSILEKVNPGLIAEVVELGLEHVSHRKAVREWTEYQELSVIFLPLSRMRPGGRSTSVT
ncbi:MAG TPA: hypothetical protein VFG71_03060, partial [Nitrospiraceae bacterium]|nr:hypothetical protein [Nitrospiraceae bacterium]